MAEPAVLESMRRDLRFVVPALQRDGWTREQIAEISAAVRAHQAAGDEAGLQAVAAWLREKAAAWLVVVQAEYEQARAAERWVVPVLGFEAERRLADKRWKKK